MSERLAGYLRRIAEVYPAVPLGDARRIRLIVDEGENNDIVAAGDSLIFRFPRYQAGVERLPRVIRVLQAIKTRLPLAVPDPRFSCLEPLLPGQAFLGYPRIAGQPLWQEMAEQISDQVILDRVAAQLATFLRQLHHIPLAQVLPDDLQRFDPLAEWRDLYDRLRAKVFPHMRSDAQALVAARFEQFFADSAKQSLSPVLVHGDFGTGNLLYDAARGEITGVVDWDGAGAGDPAVDYAALLAGLPMLAARVRRLTPELDAMMARIDFYQSTFLLQEALFGIEHGDPEAFQSGIGPYR
jgi:aminoglycoside 2''-phosphotransferase